MTPTHATLMTETEFPSEEVKPEETHDGSTIATSDASQIDAAAALEEAARKQAKAEKKRRKAEKHAAKVLAGEKTEKKKLKEKKSSAKVLAGTFPMVELIDEQVRTTIPEELV